jgi:hypothetical protein
MKSIRDLLGLSRTPDMTLFMVQEFNRHFVANGVFRLVSPLQSQHNAADSQDNSAGEQQHDPDEEADAEADEADREIDRDADDESNEEDGQHAAAAAHKRVKSKKICLPIRNVTRQVYDLLVELANNAAFDNRLLMHCPDFLVSALLKVENKPAVKSIGGLFSLAGDRSYTGSDSDSVDCSQRTIFFFSIHCIPSCFSSTFICPALHLSHVRARYLSLTPTISFQVLHLRYVV